MSSKPNSEGKPVLFHTPPPVDRTRSFLMEQSEMESYGTGEMAEERGDSNDIVASKSNSNLNDESRNGKASNNIDEDTKACINEDEQDDEMDGHLPAKLDKLVERFISSLREPRYSTPLTATDISTLYQEFYSEFKHKAELYLREGMNKGSKDFQPLETYQEITEKKRERHKRSQKLKQYVEMAEAKACTTVYNKIFTLPFSGEDQETDDYTMKRVKVLRRIPITFKHLDFQEVDERDIFPLLGKAGEELHRMNDVQTPKRKLEYLLKAHKVIVSALTEKLPKGSTSSADLILPALIYTFIYFDTPNLWLNLQFITRFRNQRAMQGENMYCLTNFEAAIRFLQHLTLESLGISEDEVPKDLDVSILATNSHPSTSQVGRVADQAQNSRTTTASSSRSRSQSDSSRKEPRSSLLERSRRLSILQNPSDIADQSIKSLGSTLGSSYRFFLGKISQPESSSSGGGVATSSITNEQDKAYPDTLEDARKVVGLDGNSTGLARNESNDSISKSAESATFMNRFSGAMFKGFRADNNANHATGASGSISSTNSCDQTKLALPIEHLLETETDSLKMSDVRTLHSEYKRLVAYLKSINAFEQ